MVEEKEEKGKRIVDLCKKILVSRGMTEDEALAAAEEIATKGSCYPGTAPVF
jgi:hypothetical protein